MKDRVRRVGGGRKRKEICSPVLVQELAEVVASHTAGCPVGGQRWTYLSISEIQACLLERGMPVSRKVIRRLLRESGLGFRKLYKNRAMKAEIAGRDEQFLRINSLKQYYLSRNYLVLSVDVKKKEWLGPFFRSGNIWSEKLVECYDHDFSSFATGQIIPHGIYDLGRKEGYLTLGQGADTAEFNVACLRQYWEQHGCLIHQPGTPILLLFDGGGSNGSRNRIFKQELQQWANDANLNIRVAHYPPYCSKYNPIEHRLFPVITQAWKGVMLDNTQTMIELIRKRTQKLNNSMKVMVSEMKDTFEKGIKVVDDYLDHCKIRFDTQNPKWNYRIFAIP